jgi:hypothetical protein
VAPGRRVSVKGLYAEYAGWCEQTGERALTQRELSQRLTERGFTAGRTSRERLWLGLGLTEESGHE